MFRKDHIFDPDDLVSRATLEQLNSCGLFTWSCDIFGKEQLMEVALFRLDRGETPHYVCEGLLPYNDLDAAKKQLKDEVNIHFGCWDKMAIANWPLIWTEGQKPMRIWDKTGLIAQVLENGDLLIANQMIPSKNILSIDTYVSENWVTRGVRISREDGEPLLIATQEKLLIEGDFYDTIDLQCDSAWAMALALELSRNLKKPFCDHIRTAKKPWTAIFWGGGF